MTDSEIIDRMEALRFVPIPVFDRKPTTDSCYGGWKVEFIGWMMNGDEKTYPTLRAAIIDWSYRNP